MLYNNLQNVHVKRMNLSDSLNININNNNISFVDSRPAAYVIFKVLEKCTKNLIGHSRLAFSNHESNIDC